MRSSIRGTYIHIRFHTYTYVCIRIAKRTCIRGTSMHVCIRINIRTIHACIHEHKTHTTVYTHTYMHFAVLTASCESQHQCEAVSRLVMSLSPSARITYSLAGTIKFEMPISEVFFFQFFFIYIVRTRLLAPSSLRCLSARVCVCVSTIYTHRQTRMHTHTYKHTQVPTLICVSNLL
jgi:hypothetical protein